MAVNKQKIPLIQNITVFCIFLWRADKKSFFLSTLQRPEIKIKGQHCEPLNMTLSNNIKRNEKQNKHRINHSRKYRG